MSKVTMPERPDPDGFLAIRLAGHEVEVNAYRDSTLDAYAELYPAARVREALEEAAKVCDDRANQNELATSGVEPDEVSSLRSAAWQMGVCARAIRALIPSTPA